jgi:hypothetical protein
MLSEKRKAVCDRLDETIRNLDAATFGSSVKPNLIEIGIGLRRPDMSH